MRKRPSLTEILATWREKSRKRIPEEKLTVMDKAGQDLAASGIAESCLHVGDTAPEFALPNAVGKVVSLAELLERGPVVLSFYRGGW